MIIWATLFVLACFTVAVSGYAINSRSKLTRLEAEMSERIGLLSRELAAVNNGAIGVGQRLINVEKKLNTTIDEQERLQASAEYQPYGQAEALAGQGVKAQQLTERFGLSESEAQLMSLLRQRPVEASLQ